MISDHLMEHGRAFLLHISNLPAPPTLHYNVQRTKNFNVYIVMAVIAQVALFVIGGVYSYNLVKHNNEQEEYIVSLETQLDAVLTYPSVHVNKTTDKVLDNGEQKKNPKLEPVILVDVCMLEFLDKERTDMCCTYTLDNMSSSDDIELSDGKEAKVPESDFVLGDVCLLELCSDEIEEICMVECNVCETLEANSTDELDTSEKTSEPADMCYTYTLDNMSSRDDIVLSDKNEAIAPVSEFVLGDVCLLELCSNEIEEICMVECNIYERLEANLIHELITLEKTSEPADMCYTYTLDNMSSRDDIVLSDKNEESEFVLGDVCLLELCSNEIEEICMVECNIYEALEAKFTSELVNSEKISDKITDDSVSPPPPVVLITNITEEVDIESDSGGSGSIDMTLNLPKNNEENEPPEPDATTTAESSDISIRLLDQVWQQKEVLFLVIAMLFMVVKIYSLNSNSQRKDKEIKDIVDRYTNQLCTEKSERSSIQDQLTKETALVQELNLNLFEF